PGADGETLSEASPAMEALSAEKIALPMEAPPMPDADAGPALVPTPALEPPATPAAEVLPPLTPASPAPASEKALPDPVFILPNTPLVLPAPVAGPNLERMPQEPEEKAPEPLQVLPPNPSEIHTFHAPSHPPADRLDLGAEPDDRKGESKDEKPEKEEAP